MNRDQSADLAPFGAPGESWPARHEGSDREANVQVRIAALRLALCRSGGTVTADSLSALLRCRSGQPISLVARWIVARKVVSFSWRFETWLPLFQFDQRGFELRPGIRQVMAELRDVFDDLELAEWFAAPNVWLGDASPADVIGLGPEPVVAAARADRFITLG